MNIFVHERRLVPSDAFLSYWCHLPKVCKTKFSSVSYDIFLPLLKQVMRLMMKHETVQLLRLKIIDKLKPLFKQNENMAIFENKTNLIVLPFVHYPKIDSQ